MERRLLLAPLLFAVRRYVMLGSVLGVLGCMNLVAVGHVRMVGGFFMVAFKVMLGGFLVMARSVLMMFRCLVVMMSCFL